MGWSGGTLECRESGVKPEMSTTALFCLPACRETTRRLGVAWLLASACLLHHLTHWLGAAAPHWLHALASTPVHATLSALALLGELAWRWHLSAAVPDRCAAVLHSCRSANGMLLWVPHSFTPFHRCTCRPRSRHHQRRVPGAGAGCP